MASRSDGRTELPGHPSSAGSIPGVRVDSPWRHLPLVLASAFAIRAAVALFGDSVLHLDEIMQYLEPAHRLAFRNAVTHWEYFYGACSRLILGRLPGR